MPTTRIKGVRTLVGKILEGLGKTFESGRIDLGEGKTLTLPDELNVRMIQSGSGVKIVFDDPKPKVSGSSGVWIFQVSGSGPIEEVHLDSPTKGLVVLGGLPDVSLVFED